MANRALLALLLTLFACGDSAEPTADEELANASRLTRARAVETGDYCCYENGALAADAPAGCRAVAGCFFNETYSDVNAAGRGTTCGYVVCDE